MGVAVSAQPNRLVVQHLTNAAQFQTVMDAGVAATSSHFVLHRLAMTRPNDRALWGQAKEAQVWMGAVLPKRHAKKAVRRNLLRRQIYSVGDEVKTSLVEGAHVVRLRRGFEADGFISASSVALKKAVRTELLDLFARACLRFGAAPPTRSSV